MHEAERLSSAPAIPPPVNFRAKPYLSYRILICPTLTPIATFAKEFFAAAGAREQPSE
jgi:hypothetical protein